MTAMIWILYLLGWVAAADCLRRPAWQWRNADRNRAFWVVLLIMLGPILVLPYAFICLPPLSGAAREGAGDDTFVKQRPNP